MLKKEEVFVRVSSKKKARKLKELLDMFGEVKDETTFKEFSEFKDSWLVNNEGTPGVVFHKNEWIGSWSESEIGLTQVSLKELRNILAAEHLKEGDVCIVSIDSLKYIVKIESVDNHDTYPINSTKWVVLGETDVAEGKGAFTNFIRYATEEEKALLEPKKEIEVGKWYKYPDYPNFLSIHSTDGNRYGFDIDGLWFNAESKLSGSDYVEATCEEVEQALIKEAKRRYKVGDKLSKIYEDCSNGDRVFGDKVEYQDSDSTIWFSDTNGYASCIFKEGQWADIIQPSNKDNDLERLSEIVNEAVTIITKLKNK